MKYSGLVLEESLAGNDCLSLLTILKREIWTVASGPQPEIWTALFFENEDDGAEAVAAALARDLKDAWYADFSAPTRKYVVFKGKVFAYEFGQTEIKQSARNYGLSLGIPEGQLDWTE
jgi:hypothetical protein